jgi:hypothetical protein
MENPKYAEDGDVARRVQAIRLEILTLTEVLHLPELENKTHKLYAQDVQHPLSKKELKNLLMALTENTDFCGRCWLLLQNFIAAVAELVVFFYNAFLIVLSLLIHLIPDPRIPSEKISHGINGLVELKFT